MTRFPQIEWMLSERHGVEPGDIVSAAAGGLPMYEVIAVEGDQAWLHDEAHHVVVEASLANLRWKAGGRPA